MNFYIFFHNLLVFNYNTNVDYLNDRTCRVLFLLFIFILRMQKFGFRLEKILNIFIEIKIQSLGNTNIIMYYLCLLSANSKIKRRLSQKYPRSRTPFRRFPGHQFDF